MHPQLLTRDALARALSLRDLTDPAQGPHALQCIVDDVVAALAGRSRVIVDRGARVVDVADNYDALGYPHDGAARDARYTRYVTPTTILRTQTSAIVPPLLRSLRDVDDALLVCPGVVYRRDVIDRLHVGEPHQCDVWRIRRAPLDADDLRAMVRAVVEAALPGRAWRVVPAVHPYTVDGRQIDVDVDGAWIEIGECGLAHPDVLAGAGHATMHGLAMGLGLDRLLMIRKGVDDIRQLRSDDPRIAAQMLDLAPYRAVSRMPPIRRDISIAVDDATTPEELGDRVRAALGDAASSLESIDVVAETPWRDVPDAARARMGMRQSHKNVLLRVVVRDLTRTLTHDEGNGLRDRVYAALHEGDRHEWARRS